MSRTQKALLALVGLAVVAPVVVFVVRSRQMARDAADQQAVARLSPLDIAPLQVNDFSGAVAQSRYLGGGIA